MNLEGHKKIKIEHRQEKKKKQEFKHIGDIPKKRGQSLYGINPDTKEVYKVIIEKKEVFDVQKKKETGTYKAIVNSEHRFIYALNIKNAKRKLNKLIS